MCVCLCTTPNKFDQIWCDKIIKETFALPFMQQAAGRKAEREHVQGVRQQRAMINGKRRVSRRIITVINSDIQN